MDDRRLHNTELRHGPKKSERARYNAIAFVNVTPPLPLLQFEMGA